MRLVTLSLLVATLAAVVCLRTGNSHQAVLDLEISPARLPADGYSSAILHASVPASFAIVQGQHAARIEGARIIAGVMGGPVVVEARARGYRPALAVLVTTALPPALALHLDDEADRDAFIGWFTWLAESAYFAARLPAEINDCAALIRFAFREALREHDGRWASDLNLDAVPAIPGLQKYAYPFTPLGARLFATGAGYAEFADARTLIRYNTYFVSRDVRRALPGDLLFFRQSEQSEPYHTMIFLGPSRFEPPAAAPAQYVVYHTGLIRGRPGEIRRPSLAELLRHPSPEWRPHLGNPNFVGIFRWNLLRRN